MRHNEILLIAGPEGHDSELIAAAHAYHPDRVTVLIDAQDAAWSWSDAAVARRRRDRLATLLTAVECATGATVVGLVGDSAQIDLRGFDAIVRDHGLLHAA